jgi:hypothetical protein
MSKIICNSIDYVFSDDVSAATPENVELKPDCSWKNLPVKEKPAYSCGDRQADAGPVREESVTAVTKFDADPLLKKQIAYGVVLRMRTDDTTFYVGSDRFPCMAEISGDRINDAYTFSAKSVL